MALDFRGQAMHGSSGVASVVPSEGGREVLTFFSIHGILNGFLRSSLMSHATHSH